MRIKTVFLICIMMFAASCLMAQTHNITRRSSSSTSKQTTTKKATTPSTGKKTGATTQKRSATNQNQQVARRAKEERRAKASLCPDGNHPHMIDLGLPSGTKWACCNVGASKPEAYGGYYAWGETETKSSYSESTYKYYQNGSYVSLGSDIAGSSYDVAHVKWGGSWMMPTEFQQDELRDNCTCVWTTVNGVKGGKFTSKKNGASIFLPAAGYRDGSGLDHVGSRGYCWSSTQSPSLVHGAYYLFFDSGGTVWSGDYRFLGRSVRPVLRN